VSKILAPRPDLGIRRLLPDWKAMLSREHLRDDVVAGLTVACIAVPLSLAIALASGVAPAVGLVTAIVAGIVCAVFGGTPLQVSGPAAAMAVLVAAIVQEHGLAALLIVGLGCGILQLATGALGLGRFIKLVPMPVVEGFTAGIGAIILVGQLPRALGLPPPPQSAVLEVITHLKDVLHETKWPALLVTMATLSVIYGLPRITRKIPAQLAAVVVATAGVVALRLDVMPIGEIPRSLPLPRLPSMPGGESIGPIAASAFIVFALASLETLLSASAVDKMAKGQRSDPDQELIGQGLGNMATAMFGGIPVTGVIARSGTNVQAGGKTRRAAIIHALVLLATVFALAPVMERIPIPALAAVLFSVAFRMLSPHTWLRLWKHQRGDGVVYGVTFIVIVFVDLLEGVQWGVAAALAIAAIRLGRTRMLVRGARSGEQYLFALEGPLTFLSSLDVEHLRNEISLLEPGRAIVFDVREVTMVDASGAEMLASLVDDARDRGLKPIVLGLREDARASFLSAGLLDAESVLATDERSLAQKLGKDGGVDARLHAGVERFRASIRPRYSRLFESLAKGQAPHTLFITCSDSRIQPNLITSTDPGELFIVRDIGNIVPPAEAIPGSSVAAALDYAVGVLGVSKVVVCGHSGCGAIEALRSKPKIPEELVNLEAWLVATEARALLGNLPEALHADDVGRVNVLRQLDHLRTYALVSERIAEGKLSLAGWFFDVAKADLEVWSDETKKWSPAGEPGEPDDVSTKRPVAKGVVA
jgi:carbonic anhydrase